jgi:transketolase
MNLETLKNIKQNSLRDILRLYKKANAGHIGASLSCLDMLVYLYFNHMHNDDKFVLSKGHAALSLYVILAKAGFIDEAELNSFYQNGTNLAAHPPCSRKLNGVYFGTGSLGHGLSLATGFAFSNKFTSKADNVYCIVSDGDCDEGSTWEAALFAAQHKLNNLCVLVDNNNLQGFGNTKDVLNLEPLADKWKAFNFDVAIAENGNDFNSLDSAFGALNRHDSDKPKCIVARTTKGNGISYMENKMEWHYLPMSDELFEQAMKEVNN